LFKDIEKGTTAEEVTGEMEMGRAGLVKLSPGNWQSVTGIKFRKNIFTLEYLNLI
jgi:hypothetical protein